jgi:hypothetical protein
MQMQMQASADNRPNKSPGRTRWRDQAAQKKSITKALTNKKSYIYINSHIRNFDLVCSSDFELFFQVLDINHIIVNKDLPSFVT